MKFRLLLIFLFFVGYTFSQSEIYYFKDVNSNLTFKNIIKQDFKTLEKEVLEKHSEATFWFKIPAIDTDLDYIFKIVSIRANNAKAYQNFKEIKPLSYQRYSSFKISRKLPVYVKVSSHFSSYFPVELDTEINAEYKEKLQLLINGFYYGTAFLVILFSLNYFFFFRDKSFLYHAFLLISLSVSFLLSDGVFHFLNVSEESIENLILLNYIFLAYSSSKFANSFLSLSIFYPKLKRYTYILGISVILSVILFSIFRDNNYYILLNVLTAIILSIYWLASVLLFHKNAHTKLFAFSYVIFLFSGIDFFVLKNFGISLFQTNAINLKIGGFIQIITLSFAVLYREKNLREYNFFMRNEIIKYSKEIEKLTVLEEEPLKDKTKGLSIREIEIFEHILLGKSNKEIANEVNISINTVKFHVKNIYGKLNIKSRKEAINTKVF